MRPRARGAAAALAALAALALRACHRGCPAGAGGPGFAACGGAARGRGLRGLRGLRGAPTRLGAGAEGQKPKLWTLAIRANDHYVWDDEAVFTSILADAGEWEVKLDVIREAFREAKSSGSAEVFSAPLYVIRDYVLELQNYGLAAEAVPAKEAAPEAEDEAAWSQKDWKLLSPDVKESLGPMREAAEASSQGPKASVVIFMSDHPSLKGGKGATARFRAYVEMGSDAAGRFCPDEGTLNACYNRIAGPAGRGEVLTNFSPEQAEKAAEQLRKAGFVVEVEMAQGGPPARSPPPAGAKAASISGGVRDLLLGN